MKTIDPMNTYDYQPIPETTAQDMIMRGQKFTVPRYSCVWTVLYYHRGGNWVCQEPKHQTTCHFQLDEIVTGLIFN